MRFIVREGFGHTAVADKTMLRALGLPHGGVISIGDTHVRVTGGSEDTIQLYELELSIASPVIFDPADFDTDGDVDDADLAIWRASFGSGPLGDADNDGDSDGVDFLAWQRHYTGSQGTVSTSAVPEPSTGLLCLAASGMVSLLCRSRGVRNWQD